MFIVSDKKEVNVETLRIAGKIQGNSAWSWTEPGLGKGLAGAGQGLAVGLSGPLPGSGCCCQLKNTS